MTGHSVFSPSGAHRWMACPGSVVLEADRPQSRSKYADEGTAAHGLGAWCLLEDKDPSAYKFPSIVVEGTEIPVTDEMRGAVGDYVAYVRERASLVPSRLSVEKRVALDGSIGAANAFGTVDALVVGSTGHLTVVDLKYGAGVPVAAKDNEQLMLYALGAFDNASCAIDIKGVEIVIHQPRAGGVKAWRVSLDELEAFRLAARVAVAEVISAQRSKSIEPFLKPGEKQCKWCRAKPVCPAMKESVDLTVTAATAKDFADLYNTPGDVLAQAFSRLSLVEMWCEAIRAETERRLLNGDNVPGFKLVEGRRGARRWTNEEAVIAVLKAARLKTEEIYDMKVNSPTKLEKALKPAQWVKLADLIEQARGKPSVVSETDKRPALPASSVADDLRDI